MAGGDVTIEILKGHPRQDSGARAGDSRASRGHEPAVPRGRGGNPQSRRAKSIHRSLHQDARRATRRCRTTRECPREPRPQARVQVGSSRAMSGDDADEKIALLDADQEDRAPQGNPRRGAEMVGRHQPGARRLEWGDQSGARPNQSGAQPRRSEARPNRRAVRPDRRGPRRLRRAGAPHRPLHEGALRAAGHPNRLRVEREPTSHPRYDSGRAVVRRGRSVARPGERPDPRPTPQERRGESRHRRKADDGAGSTRPVRRPL